MHKIRIYKKEDGDLIIQGFGDVPLEQIISLHIIETHKNLPIFHFDMCELKHDQHFNGCCDFPRTDHIDKWYLDENNKITTDTNWQKVIMPSSEIVNKHVARCEKKIDAELEKPTPNATTLLKHMNEREKIKVWHKKDPKKVYEISLRELDASTSNIDRSEIRLKLQEKISLLSQT